MTPSEGLPRVGRLTRTSEIRGVFGSGRRRRLRYLDIVWARNAAGHARLGLVVPMFQSNAVTRNRLRRRLREIWRRQIAPKLGAVDVVVRARREAYEAGFGGLREDLVAWADRIATGLGP